MITRLRRWAQWNYCVAAWIGGTRKETNFGFSAKYNFDSGVDPPPRRAVKRCQRYGFPLQLAFDAARAKVRGNYSDWRKEQGVGLFQAPDVKDA